MRTAEEQGETGGAVASASRSWSPRRDIVCLAGASLVLVLHAIHLACIAEDSHISFRFARNWAEGYGLVWNPGEAPVEGFTNLLWVAISAAVIRAGLDVMRVMQALGVAAAVATLLYAFAFARCVRGSRGASALVAPALLAVSGPLATWAGSAMETTAFGLCVLAACTHYGMALRRASPRGVLLASVLAFLATTLRPEGALVFAVLAGLGVVLAWDAPAPLRRRLGLGIAVYALAVAGLTLGRLAVFGDPLPNTFYAKTGGSVWQYARGAVYVAFFAFFFLVPLLPALFQWVWEGGLRAPGRMAWSLPALRRLAREHVAVTVAAAVSLPYLAYVVYVGGDYMAMYRFLVPVLPLLYLLFAFAVEDLVRRVDGTPRKRALTGALVGFAALATLFHSTPLEASLFRVPPYQHGNHRGVQAERWHVARLGAIADFFARRAAPGESLATRAIGVLGYGLGIRVVDLSGLTVPAIARRPVENLGRGWAGHEKADLEFVLVENPTYVMFTRRFPAGSAEPPALEGAGATADWIDAHYDGNETAFAELIRRHSEFFDRHYHLAHTWLEDPANAESGWFAFLERKASGAAEAPREPVGTQGKPRT